MEDLITTVRNHILDRLEGGDLETGAKLSGSRDLARETGISVPTVQNALETLVREGILETVSRRGTFIRAEWESRLVPNSMLAGFSGHGHFRNEFCRQIKTEIPELWLSKRLKHAIFEIRPTHYVQSHCMEYLDLSELFEQNFPNQDEFFMKPFESFRISGRLVGVPLLFSPRVIFYNPSLLRLAGCRMPGVGWTWDDFIGCVRNLRQIIPPGAIFNWYSGIHVWMNFVARTGGCLINPEAGDPIQIDSAATRRGLRLFRELRHELWGDEFYWPDRHAEAFLNGRAAMMISQREFMPMIVESGLKDWNTAPLPLIPDGQDVNVQATDLLCIRRECLDLPLAGKLLRFLLSEAFQNRIADFKYGIPIRKNAAGRTIDFNDPRDMLFFNEIPKMYPHYNIESVDLFNIISQGIARLLASDEDIDAGTAEIADMARTYLKIKNYNTQINVLKGA